MYFPKLAKLVSIFVWSNQHTWMIPEHTYKNLKTKKNEFHFSSKLCQKLEKKKCVFLSKLKTHFGKSITASINRVHQFMQEVSR